MKSSFLFQIFILEILLFVNGHNKEKIGSKDGKIADYRTSLTVTPTFQIAAENEDVIIDCKERENREVKWVRENNKLLPRGSVQHKGRLLIKAIHHKDAGVYICIFQDKLENYVVSKSSIIKVMKNFNSKSTVGLPKNNFTILTTENPLNCFQNLCNGTCCGNNFNKTFFNYTQDFNNYEDVSRPKLTVLPKPKIEVFCGDQEKEKAGILVLECEFIAKPEPLIKWKKYEGHVPLKCQQSSFGGRGVLTCPNFQQSDQGAYSCVGENSEKSSESQPKSIAKCSNRINCKGFRVVNDEQIENCLECFCSGKTNKCEALGSNLTLTKFPFPTRQTEVFAIEKGDIVFIPSEEEPLPSSEIRNSTEEITYCLFDEEDLNGISFLKSYGRNINIPKYKGKIELFPKAPDIIIQGNGVSLTYRFNSISHSAEAVDIRFWPGNWYHLNKTAAKREDIMKVLSNVNAILFRCEYKKNNISPEKEAHVYIESSIISNSQSSVSFLEKCDCPEGYEGLSCESCAPGFKKIVNGSDFLCEPNTNSSVCSEGSIGDNCETCDINKNYYWKGKKCLKATCNLKGSTSPDSNTFGKCNCKKEMTGDLCDKCKPGFFSFQSGCIKCWCNDVTDQCNSSNWVRTLISGNSLGGYNSSDGKNFWLLPSAFCGNHLSSYGGYLNYTLKYAPNTPKQKDFLTVKFLTMNNVTLSYTHPNIDNTSSYLEKSWSVRLIEKFWKKSDSNNVSRAEFLSMLLKVKAVYIESPYHISSGLVNLTAAHMSSAKLISFVAGDETAMEVEQCTCPEGYIGLSCESCAQGYYKSSNKTSFKCLKCDCPFCDPERGCVDCPAGTYRDNPMDQEHPICKPCPCNKNELSCYKDSYEQIFCNCKQGFMGIHCENFHSEKNKSYSILKITPRKIKSRKVGTKIKFTCSYGSDEKMKVVVKTINLQGLQNELEVTDIPPEKDYNNTKSFEVVLKNDLKSIECSIFDKEEEIGQVKAIVEDLIINFEPVAIKNCYSNVIDLIENEEKELTCEATGSPLPTVNWFRIHKKNKMEKLDTVSGVHTIKPSDSILDNNGTIYTCMAENSEGNKAACTRILLIRRKCDAIYIDPKFSRVKEGHKITLKCTTMVPSSLSWSRLNSTLPLSRHKITGGVLEIFNSTLNDSGIYLCQAKTESGSINKTVSVIVEEKKQHPSVFIKENDRNLNVGENFEVTCVASGKPFPNIIWFKANDVIANNVLIRDEKLFIKNARIENSGIYGCQGRSALGNATAFIYIKVKKNLEKPFVEIAPGPLVKPILGQTLSLACRATKGFPLPSLEWYKKERGIWVKLTNSYLKSFENVQHTDSGKYKCIGNNSLGEAEALVEVDVLLPPRVNISEEKIETYLNEEVKITCLAFGYPAPNISWFGQPINSTSKSLKSDSVLLDSLKSTKKQLSFLATNDVAGAVITCSAENEAGKDNKTITLKFLQQTGHSNTDTVELASLGSSFVLTCEHSLGNITWEKVGEKLEGSECPFPNGLLIPSVQVQHAGVYICRSISKENNFKKKITLKVVGFVPKFNQGNKTYLILPATLKSDKEFRIQISFKPTSENGVLLQKGKHELEIHLKHGKIHLSLHPKGSSFELTSDKTIVLNNWYSLVILISKTYVDLTIYDKTTPLLERITKYFHVNFTFNRIDNFAVGGVLPMSKTATHWRQRMFSREPSFDGCVSRLIIDHHEFDLVKEASFSYKTELCKQCLEEPNPCQEEGKCFDAPTQYGFICVCPEKNKITSTCPSSCSGKNCETQMDLCKLINPCRRYDLHSCHNNLYSLQCDCAFGYSGTTCEKEEQYSFCVKGDGFIKLSSIILERHLLQASEIIKIVFTSQEPDGVLLWQGNEANYLLIRVRGSILEYIYFNQNVELSIATYDEIPILQKVTMIATRNNETVTLEVYKNSNQLFKASKSTTFTTNRVFGDIYLGNLPKLRHVNHSGLVGCIHSVTFNNKTKVNFHEYAEEIVKATTQARFTYLNKISDFSYDSDSSAENDTYEYLDN